MLVRRKILPTGVTRGSFSVLNSGPVRSLSGCTSSNRASASAVIVRNLCTRIGLPSRPTRVCRKNTRPPSCSLIATAPVTASVPEQLQVHGANTVSRGDAETIAADLAGVLPAGFYSTTNLATDVRVDGHWIEVENPDPNTIAAVAPDAVTTLRTSAR